MEQNKAGPGRELKRILTMAVELKASDIHIKPGNAPIIRVNGALIDLPKANKISPNQIAAIARRIMTEEQLEHFREFQEVDLAYSFPGVGRFRISIFQQRGTVAMALRLIPPMVNSWNQLLLPSIIKKIANFHRGLVIVTGATGSGKSTTLAAMIDHINETSRRHIITIEDPIEFLMRDKKSIISQREVGFDTTTFSKALRSALRQDPDVILVGEMRDVETITTAVQAAETGHLVLSTLHTVDVMETVNRILSFYTAHQLDQVRFELSTALKAIICQRLLPRADKKGRVPAVEIMINNSRIRDCIKFKEKAGEIVDAMQKGYSTDKMQTFDMSLMILVRKQLVAYEDALKYASNPGDFALKFKGVSSTSDHEFEQSTGMTDSKDDTEKIATTDKMIIERFSK